jgi:glycosyltransferase involved in cell wall biosynthesis
MNEPIIDREILFLTSYNPFIYRRPFMAKLAFPKLKTIDYVEAYEQYFGVLGKYLRFIKSATGKIESLLFETPQDSGSYAISAYLNNFLFYFPINKIKSETIITLNTTLASKRIIRDRKVIVDWMDVWMSPWDQMNPLDVQAVKEADGVIFWSRPLATIMTKRLNLKKVAYVPYGVNLMDFDPLQFGNEASFRRKFKLENKFLITYSGGTWRSGNLDLQGTDKILKAFQLISDRLKNAVLILQLLNIDEQTSKLLKELKIKNRIVIIGRLPFKSRDRIDLFSATDLFIAPTARHPVSYYAERMKFFQYMTAGKPILTEDAPGTKSVFGETAYYVKLDDVDAMADAILKLHNDVSLRENLGNASRKRVENQFEWSKIVPIYRDFIISIHK